MTEAGDSLIVHRELEGKRVKTAYCGAKGKIRISPYRRKVTCQRCSGKAYKDRKEKPRSSEEAGPRSQASTTSI